MFSGSILYHHFQDNIQDDTQNDIQNKGLAKVIPTVQLGTLNVNGLYKFIPF